MPDPKPKPATSPLVKITRKVAKRVDSLRFDEPVDRIYNPLVYARRPHEIYLNRFGHGTKHAMFLGMNPGPFGMAQTGVPFGEVAAVRDWLDLSGRIGSPPSEHAYRPVTGFSCQRSEVSGARLWGLFRDEFGEPERFFRHAFVWNYCPLLFTQIVESGAGQRKLCRNVTPDKIIAAQREALFEACDQALIAMVEYLNPRYLVGVGGFAEACFERLFGASGQYRIERILHPSPASPLANRGFAAAAKTQLQEMGLWVLLQAP